MKWKRPSGTTVNNVVILALTAYQTYLTRYPPQPQAPVVANPPAPVAASTDWWWWWPAVASYWPMAAMLVIVGLNFFIQRRGRSADGSALRDELDRTYAVLKRAQADRDAANDELKKYKTAETQEVGKQDQKASGLTAQPLTDKGNRTFRLEWKKDTLSAVRIYQHSGATILPFEIRLTKLHWLDERAGKYCETPETRDSMFPKRLQASTEITSGIPVDAGFVHLPANNALRISLTELDRSNSHGLSVRQRGRWRAEFAVVWQGQEEAFHGHFIWRKNEEPVMEGQIMDGAPTP